MAKYSTPSIFNFAYILSKLLPYTFIFLNELVSIKSIFGLFISIVIVICRQHKVLLMYKMGKFRAEYWPLGDTTIFKHDETPFPNS